MSDERTSLSVELHGPGVTIEDALETGEATKRLLDAASEVLGAPVGWEVAAVYFKCDGCGLRRPDRPAPDEGWSHHDSDDFCPTCTDVRSGVVS